MKSRLPSWRRMNAPMSDSRLSNQLETTRSQSPRFGSQELTVLFDAKERT